MQGIVVVTEPRECPPSVVWGKSEVLICEDRRRHCQLIRFGTSAMGTLDKLTKCFLQAARAEVVTSRQLWNRFCIS
jgi:hypothetical protein